MRPPFIFVPLFVQCSPNSLQYSLYHVLFLQYNTEAPLDVVGLAELWALSLHGFYDHGIQVCISLSHLHST